MTVMLGDLFDVLPTLDDCSVDAVVTDPPYGINFMGKAWDGKAIEEAAARPVQLDGIVRLTGSPDSPERKLTARTGSGFANRAGEAGAYDFSTKGNHAFQAWCQLWATELLRVLKPGGHLLAFGGTRTYHRLTCALEDAGFEIRDSIGMPWTDAWGPLAWVQGKGFPKSLDVSKAIDNAQGATREVVGPDPEAGRRNKAAPRFNGTDYAGGEEWQGASDVPVTAAATPEAERWHGWGTALKPAWEPIVVARKPLSGTVAANVLEHGTGGLNIDGCRIEVTDAAYDRNWSGERGHEGTRGVEERGATDMRMGGGKRPLRLPGNTDTDGKNTYGGGVIGGGSEAIGETTLGRWPANVVLTEEGAALLDEQTGTLASGKEPSAGFVPHEPGSREGIYGGGKGLWKDGQDAGALYGDSGGASRFFYCSKVSRAERNAGLEGFDPYPLNWSSGEQNPGTFQAEGTEREARNHHPTVKPVALMRWLVRLVTPPDGTVLDPFTGSGTTGIACALEGFRFIGIEREADYHRIAEARIAWWTEHGERALDVAKIAAAERPPPEQEAIFK